MKTLSIIALPLMLGASLAQAEELIDATDFNVLAEIAKGFGSANVETDDVGEPIIRGRIKGTRYAITSHGCNDAGEKCEFIRFVAGWATPVSALKVNQWNDQRVFGKAIRDEEGELSMEYPVNLKFGVSRENFDDTVDWWRVILAQTEEFFALN